MQTIRHSDPFADLATIAPPVPYVEAEDRRARYFFYAGDEPGRLYPGGLSVNTLCVPNKLIRRCQVTPCVSVWSPPKRKEEIPDGRMILGTQDIRPGMAQEWMYAGPEAETLLYEYGNQDNSSKNWGLVELLPKLLTGMEWPIFRQLAITEIVFPQWPDVPETNAGVLMHLQEMGAIIKNNAHPEFKWNSNDIRTIERRDIYLGCIEQMIAAVEAAHAYQTDAVTTANLNVTLPSTEPGYKKKFDERDTLFAKRTGVALAVNSLRQNTSNPLENLVNQLTAKLQPQAPAQDNTAATVAAVIAALRAEGMLNVPAQSEQVNGDPPTPKIPKIKS